MRPAEITEAVRERVRSAAGNRCGFCRSSQQFVMARLEVEHIVPRSRGGTDDEANLWLSCPLCNRAKASQVSAVDPASGQSVSLYNPRTQAWGEHFAWSADGAHVIGTTATGRATVEALRMNNPLAVEVRRNWVCAGWHPPEE